MSHLPKAIENAIEALSDLPGIGNRSAERLVFTLLKNKTGLNVRIGKSLSELTEGIHECKQCCFYSEKPLCPICENRDRHAEQICIVESPMDVIALERTHQYKGLYHILHGVISPLNKIGPEDIRTPELFTRIKNHPEINEIIIATSGSTESDATAHYIAEQLKEIFSGTVSRLSRGIPSGGDLDYLDAGTLTQALMERRKF